MIQQRPDAETALLDALRELGRAPDPEVLRVMAEHRKRPHDPSQLGKFIVDVAAGQVEDRAPTPEEQSKDPAAAALGRKSGALK
jgi:hypothetical protein